MEITGTIIQKLDLQKGTSAKGEWKKQEFIVETSEKFPKKICVSAWAEKVDDLSRFNTGEKAKVSVNIESREYNGKWYTEVRAWKIEGLGASHGDSNQDFDESQDTSDDLPF